MLRVRPRATLTTELLYSGTIGGFSEERQWVDMQVGSDVDVCYSLLGARLGGIDGSWSVTRF